MTDNTETTPSERTVKVLMFAVTEPLANILFNWANIFVAVGAAFGLIGVVGIFAMGAAKEQFANERITANEASTARAKADAELAKTGAAEAGARVAEARAEAASADARAAEAKLELAKFRANRALDDHARSRVATAMASFRGTQFDVAFAQGESEQAVLALQIETSLGAAQWHQVNWQGGDIIQSRVGRRDVGIIGVRNILIGYSSRSPHLASVATTLAAVLSREGITAIAGMSDATNAQNTGAIHVLIGRKQ